MDRALLLSEVIGTFAEATKDRDTLVAVVSQRLAGAFGDLCSVLLLDEGGQQLEIVAMHDTNPEVLAIARHMLSSEPFTVVPTQRRVLDTGEPYLATFEGEKARDLTTEMRASFVERIGMHCSLVVPMRVRGTSIGILNLARHRTDRGRYDEGDIELAQLLADHAAVAIANARHLQAQYEDLRRAKDAAEATARQLRVANEAARAANRQLEQFSDSIAQHLKAPLRAIDGFAGVIEVESAARLDEQGRAYLTRVRAASARMSRLVEDLLAFSRIGQAPIARERIDLTKLARRILFELGARTAQTREVASLVAEDLACDGDPRLVRILLEHLLDNARKFTTGRPSPCIEIFAEEAAGLRVFVVRDNGIGFDAKRGDRLFVPFARLHASPELDGTGLGLATVQRIVSLHGGQIWAESGHGGGATFRFTLAEARLSSPAL